jgi:60 kDa SS-A/Ro ribonucleoprotein
MFDFTQHVKTRLRRHGTPQPESIVGSTQVANAAGGQSWVVDDWTRLDRFLIFGSERGTYYIREARLTRENASAVEACIAADGGRVVRRAVEVSESGRAPSNDAALFVLALAASADELETRAAAFAALPAVARTATSLFHWLEYVKAFRGWGRGVRNAVARWYTEKPPRTLAYQLLKYQSRDGWSHRDALRLAHPKAPSFEHDLLFKYVTKGWEGVVDGGVTRCDVGARIEAVQAIREMSPADAARVIRIYGITREMVPTELLRHAVVWEALLPSMPLTAIIRSLGVMSRVGLLTAGSDAARTIVARLTDADGVARSRVHPVGVLAALKAYARGRGFTGRGSWIPVPQVIDALDFAFYRSFQNVPWTGKRVMLALDISGSMMAPVAGMPYLTCREASAAMALITAATGEQHRFVAFTEGTLNVGGLGTALTPLTISPRQRLDDVVRSISDLTFGGTDCALPIVEATKHRWPVDAFVVYTDSETSAGPIHPAEALRQYRQRTGIAAKLVVVAMTSNGFSIADPDDAGMLDVVGFDAATPHVISDFIG